MQVATYGSKSSFPFSIPIFWSCLPDIMVSTNAVILDNTLSIRNYSWNDSFSLTSSPPILEILNLYSMMVLKRKCPCSSKYCSTFQALSNLLEFSGIFWVSELWPPLMLIFDSSQRETSIIWPSSGSWHRSLPRSCLSCNRGMNIQSLFHSFWNYG